MPQLWGFWVAGTATQPPFDRYGAVFAARCNAKGLSCEDSFYLSLPLSLFMRAPATTQQPHKDTLGNVVFSS